MGYTHEPERFTAWKARWAKARGAWSLVYGAVFGAEATWRYGGNLTDQHAVTCLDCATVNDARFYREQR